MVDKKDLPFLPYGRQSINDHDLKSVTDVLKSDFLTTGPLASQFEQALSSKLYAPFATVCSSGTAALHLALAAMKSTGRLKEGDAVIVPSMTFVATANCIELVGAKPIFADCDPDTGLMENVHAEEAYLRAMDMELRVRGMIAVHMNGQTADLSALKTFAEGNGLFLIEDAAHAIGTKYGDYYIGSGETCDLTCFSFHPVKTMTLGEGGAVTTADKGLHQAVQLLRTHGITRHHEDFTHPEAESDPWYYEMHEPGFNYRATDFQCALGLSQLGRLDGFLKRRQEIVSQYDTAFADPSHASPLYKHARGDVGWHLYPLLIDFKGLGKPRRQVMEELKAKGIGTQVHYIPVHSQPYYKRTCSTPDLSGAAQYYERVLSIPLYPDLSDGDVERVIDAVKKVVG